MLRLTLIAAVLCLAPAAHAQTAPLIDGGALVGPPPAAGSPQEAADRLSMRPAVSAERLAQARADQTFDPWRIFQPVLGDGFNEQALPRTKALIDATVAAVMPTINAVKTQYDRTRPYAADRSVFQCDDPGNVGTNGSYPTSHGAGGWALALVLAELVPAQADALLQRGHAFGESRLICGYHFPTDIESSRLIAAGVVARLHADPAYRRQLDAARRELARALD